MLTSRTNRTKQVLFPSVAPDGEERDGDEGDDRVLTSRTYTGVLEQLKAAGLRPTRQRLALAKLLLESGPRHVTAEELFHQARTAGIPVSLATVYNTLHQFTSVGLLREVVVDMGQSYFDTNTSHHHHFFDESSGALTDIPDDDIEIGRLPTPPLGSEIERVEVIVRLRRTER